MILIVSHPGDEHAREVLAALHRGGHPAVMVDTAAFPLETSMVQSFNGQRLFQLNLNGQSIDLEACRVGWWRRPQQFRLQPDMSAEAAAFAYTECHEAMAGLWAALPLTWVNPPPLDEAAHHKPYQLAIACELGIPIPKTLITNDPAAARRFVSELGNENTVYKTFLASEQCWRETRILRSSEIDMLERVRLAPVIFQEFIPAIADVRVTIIGNRMFAAKITPAPGGYAIDYRMDMARADFQPTRLPRKVENALRRFMRRLGLVYGAVDLRCQPDGDYVFLEVNPAGEWRFVEERTSQPITQTMADLLASLSHGSTTMRVCRKRGSSKGM